jgi:two-component sensor histidine kinase
VWDDPDAMQGATDFPHGFGAKLKKALIEGKWHGTISIERELGYRFSLEIPLPERSSAPVGLPVEPNG